MPKPQHTYLRVNRVTKIRHQARLTRERVVPANMSAAGLDFDRMLDRAGVDFPDIRRTIHRIQAESSTLSGSRDRKIKELVELMEKLDDLADAIASHGSQQTQLVGPAKLFMLKINGAELDGVGFAQGLLAVTMFVALLERAYHKYRTSG